MTKWGAFFSSLFPGGDSRRTGRFPVETSLLCNLGTVKDCSGSGLRIQSHRRVRGPVVMVRLWDDRGGFECEARVVWSARRGFLRFEAGLLLPPLDDRDRAQLTRLAMAHRDHRMQAPRDAA